MAWHQHAQQELDHIRSMIVRLEHLGVGNDPVHSSAVTQADYWRKRIRKVLALPDVSRRMTEQGLTLLARLDRLQGARPDTTGRI